MKRISFTIRIGAPQESVWKALWDDRNYRKWTSAFSEGSYAVTDWQEGSKVLFLSPSGEGMYSTIARKVPNALMSFRHLGTVKDGREQPASEETRKWAGAMEEYALIGTEGGTELTVNMDITEDHEQYFRDAFPKALRLVQSIAEGETAPPADR